MLVAFVIIVVIGLVFGIINARKNAPKKRIEVPSGQNYLDAFIYDGRPIKDVALNTPFQLMTVRGEVEMESIYTGTVHKGTGCLYSTGLHPVGFLDRRIENYGFYFDKLTEKYTMVYVWAVIVAYDRGGWPIVKLTLPEQGWFVGEVVPK